MCGVYARARTWTLYVRERAWVLTPAPQAMLKVGHLVIPLFDILFVSQQLRVFYVDLLFHFESDFGDAVGLYYLFTFPTFFFVPMSRGMSYQRIKCITIFSYMS